MRVAGLAATAPCAQRWTRRTSVASTPPDPCSLTPPYPFLVSRAAPPPCDRPRARACSRRICSPKTPRLLSYLIGDKVNIVTLRKDQALAIREEYHAFRQRAVWVMGAAPMLLYLGMKRADAVLEEGQHTPSLAPPLLTGVWCVRSWARRHRRRRPASQRPPPQRAPDVSPAQLAGWAAGAALPACHHARAHALARATAGLQAYFAWLCYFYVAMALRECVLLVNGSHIRAWWISHHVWSAAGSLVMLALPISSPSEGSCAACVLDAWWLGSRSCPCVVGSSQLGEQRCLSTTALPHPAPPRPLPHPAPPRRAPAPQPCTTLRRTSCCGARSRRW
jgi:hypothetical protein